MATHDELMAERPPNNRMTVQEREHRIAYLLQRALGGLYGPARVAALQRIVSTTLAAGGEAAGLAFVMACQAEARRDAHGRLPEKILSRAHAGDARAHEGAPDPVEDEP